MSAGRPLRTLQWLLHPDAGDPLPLMPDGRQEVQGDGWTLSAERLVPRPGLHIFLNRIRAERAFVLEPARETMQHQVHSTTLARGRAHLSTYDGKHFDLSTNRALAYSIADRSARFAIAPGDEVVSFGITLSGGAISEMLAERAPKVLVQLAEGRSQGSHLVGWTPTPQVRTLLRAAFAIPYEGPLRELYLEGVALQLLALQAAALDEQAEALPGKPLSARERAAVQAARVRLLADMRRPPSLGQLAAEARLTSKRLNEGFRELFGATAFELLRTERLEHAKQAIVEADDLPLKEIAWRVGYRHITNFIAAFTQHFGEAPGRWRRRATRRSSKAA